MKIQDSTAIELTQARFEEHVQSMSRLASLLLSELRGPMTRLLYDAEFIGRLPNLEGDVTLRETFADVRGSSHDLQIWVNRLARFVERGVNASEEISVGELLGLATRAAGTSAERSYALVEHADPHLPVITNVVLASEMLADVIRMLGDHAGASRVRATTQACPGPQRGVKILLRPSEPFRPKQGMRELSTSPREGACPPAFDVLECALGVLGGSMVVEQGWPGSIEITLPGSSHPSEWEKSR